MQRIRPFGTLDDGTRVSAYLLGHDDGLQAHVLDFGGILAMLSLSTPTGRIPLITGLADAHACQRDTAYMGMVIGRYANRIAGARFRLHNQEFRLSANQGLHHLHGGIRGLGQRTWSVLAHDDTHLHLHCRSPDGEEGYPGEVEINLLYQIDGHALVLQFDASTSAPTPLSLSFHPYFNLSGDPACPADLQWLQVNAHAYLPVDAQMIPDGRQQPVAGTAFDFLQPRQVRARMQQDDPQLHLAAGFDHCMVLDPARDHDAVLYSPHSRIAMQLDSDAPGLQLYAGQHLQAAHPDAGSGLCLEPQDFPDAPNRPGFPAAIAWPGRPWQRRISYRFRQVPAGAHPADRPAD